MDTQAADRRRVRNDRRDNAERIAEKRRNLRKDFGEPVTRDRKVKDREKCNDQLLGRFETVV